MNEIIEMQPRESGIVSAENNRFSAGEIRDRVNLVQSVMQAVMKKDTHFGTIPGTPKPTLYKPGAEVLCVTFRVAPKYRVEDLSTDLIARFRVTCIGVHQTSGIELGEGLGECSSGEEKYKWRRASCTEEFDQFAENMRRVKISSYQNNVKKVIQVRTEAADLSNTILKMACKRAMIAMTLNVTAASDIFTQDIEDLPEELRHLEPEVTLKEPVEKARPPLTDKGFAKAIEAVRSKSFTAEQVKADYTLTKDQETAIEDAEKESA